MENSNNSNILRKELWKLIECGNTHFQNNKKILAPYMDKWSSLPRDFHESDDVRSWVYPFKQKAKAYVLDGKKYLDYTHFNYRCAFMVAQLIIFPPSVRQKGFRVHHSWWSADDDIMTEFDLYCDSLERAESLVKELKKLIHKFVKSEDLCEILWEFYLANK